MLLKSTPYLLLIGCLLILACEQEAKDPAGIPLTEINLDQPNILWIVAEDLGPWLPDFGDPTIQTPNISRLVQEGVRYTHVFSPSGVCAPSRSAIASGMYPSRIGSNHMRTGPWFVELEPQMLTQVLAGMQKYYPEGLIPYEAVPPPEVRMHGEYMRRAGYYCTNNAKEDYQWKKPLTTWDECSPAAHWRNRPEGMPFFSIVNINVTHESQIWAKANDSLQVDSNLKVPVPPYLPDTEIGRQDIRRMYSNIVEMDQKVGQILAELEADSLLENTIVFWYTDHGGPLPRQKRLLYDSGMRLPMVIRFPNQQYAGTTDARLISFIDFLPTLLSLSGQDIPAYMDGQAFLGPKTAQPRSYVHGASDRFDEFYDGVRAVRDHKFKYLRNLDTTMNAYVPVGYRENMPIMKELLRLKSEGKLSPEQALWFSESRAPEELYDTEADPHEIINLATDPAFAQKLQELRAECDRWMNEKEDKGLISEAELLERFWPGQQQPKTENPAFELSNGKVSVNCSTEGATIAYQFLAEVDTLAARWQVYQMPISIPEGEKIALVSQRIGYARSDTVYFQPPGE